MPEDIRPKTKFPEVSEGEFRQRSVKKNANVDPFESKKSGHRQLDSEMDHDEERYPREEGKKDQRELEKKKAAGQPQGGSQLFTLEASYQPPRDSYPPPRVSSRDSYPPPRNGYPYADGFDRFYDNHYGRHPQDYGPPQDYDPYACPFPSARDYDPYARPLSSARDYNPYARPLSLARDYRPTSSDYAADPRSDPNLDSYYRGDPYYSLQRSSKSYMRRRTIGGTRSKELSEEKEADELNLSSKGNHPAEGEIPPSSSKSSDLNRTSKSARDGDARNRRSGSRPTRDRGSPNVRDASDGRAISKTEKGASKSFDSNTLKDIYTRSSRDGPQRGASPIYPLRGGLRPPPSNLFGTPTTNSMSKRSGLVSSCYHLSLLVLAFVGLSTIGMGLVGLGFVGTFLLPYKMGSSLVIPKSTTGSLNTSSNGNSLKFSFVHPYPETGQQAFLRHFLQEAGYTEAYNGEPVDLYWTLGGSRSLKGNVGKSSNTGLSEVTDSSNQQQPTIFSELDYRHQKISQCPGNIYSSHKLYLAAVLQDAKHVFGPEFGSILPKTWSLPLEKEDQQEIFLNDESKMVAFILKNSMADRAEGLEIVWGLNQLKKKIEENQVSKQYDQIQEYIVKPLLIKNKQDNLVSDNNLEINGLKESVKSVQNATTIGINIAAETKVTEKLQDEGTAPRQVVEQKTSVQQKPKRKLISKPNRKFGIRMYVLLASIDPLEIYVSTEKGMFIQICTDDYYVFDDENANAEGTTKGTRLGIIKFVSNNYTKQIKTNLESQICNPNTHGFEHLPDQRDTTGWKSFDPLQNKVSDSYPPIAPYYPASYHNYANFSYLVDNGFVTKDEYQGIIQKIQRKLGQVMIVLYEKQRLVLHQQMQNPENCFELFGADFVIDDEKEPYLLELNAGADLKGWFIEDHEGKVLMLRELFEAMGKRMERQKQYQVVENVDTVGTATSSIYSSVLSYVPLVGRWFSKQSESTQSSKKNGNSIGVIGNDLKEDFIPLFLDNQKAIDPRFSYMGSEQQSEAWKLVYPVKKSEYEIKLPNMLGGNSMQSVKVKNQNINSHLEDLSQFHIAKTKKFVESWEGY